jgi:predicted O-linked N-acetylglucosamine transferase (SPINDLY family)
MAKAHNNLGNVLNAQGKYEQAASCFRQALALKPGYAEAYNNLAITLKEQGHWEEAKTVYRHLLTLTPDWAAAHSNLLFCLSHDLQTETGQLYAEHLAFGERFESPLRATWQPHPNSKDPNRRLQVGFVSGDFFDHAVANFHLPLFEHLAHKPGLALHAYYTHNRNDAISQRLRAYFAHWHDVPQLSEAALAEQIRADGIDILIDLSGHTANNRLLTFARKPAPVQASWLGYLGTTGLQAMDYYLCDRFWLPPGELDWQLTEKPAFLPNAVVFEPSPQAPPVSPLPALTKGHFTFASFNRTNKINPSVIALWSMLLRELPSARMLLAGIPADRQAGLVQSFVQEGIAPERLLLHARSTLRDYLALHQQVDLCLDTYPYGGGATTAHAAWMGVPTLCLAGDTPPSRFGATEMHHLGLDAFIATSIEDFVAKGRYWAEHTSDLAEIRAGLRTRFADSPLGQADAFASHFEAALRAMWARWCQGLPPATLFRQGDAGAPGEATAQQRILM